MNHTIPCHYCVLNIAPRATDAEITKAYRQAALRLHPDKHPDNKEWATKQFQQLGDSYEFLKDPEKRAHWDDF
ncbi:DnaJ domain-containing protein, partial [Sphaerosporella brunnea]